MFVYEGITTHWWATTCTLRHITYGQSKHRFQCSGSATAYPIRETEGINIINLLKIKAMPQKIFITLAEEFHKNLYLGNRLQQ